MNVVSPGSRYQTQKIEADNAARLLRVSWADGRQSAYPFIWLRHALYHPAAGREEQGLENTWRITEDPTLPKIGETNCVGPKLEIHWAHDGTTTVHDLTWLRNNCVSEEGRAERRHVPKLWEKSDVDRFPWFENADLADSQARLRLFIHLRDYGLARVRNVPLVAGALKEVAQWFGPIHITHYGEIFDIRSTPEDRVGVGANIGATQALELALHTDEGYRHSPIGINFFHCLKPDPDGKGESIFIDGIAAAERLRRKNPDAFKFLTSVPIMFAAERNPTERFRARGHVIATDIDGIVRGVRITDRTLPPLDLPVALIEPAYRALAAFRSELYDLSYATEQPLLAGECIIFDNHRVLHARRSFNKQSGERWLQQLSVNREEFQNRLRVLAESHGRHEDAWFEQDAGALSHSLSPLA
jgi:gamma-butyrobetaine dioxygenase